MGALHFTTDSTMAASQMLSFGIGMYSSLILVLSLISLAAASEECVDTIDVSECQNTAVGAGICSVPHFQTNCRRTCGLCEEDCTVDVYEEYLCENIVNDGMCHDFEWGPYCRRSCGLCEDDDSSMMSTAQPAEMSEDCVDMDPIMCSMSVSDGMCNNPGMDVHCRRSCGFCEDDDSSMMSTAQPAEMSEDDSSVMSTAHPAEMSEDDSSMMSTARPTEMSEDCVDLAGEEMCQQLASVGTCTIPYGDTEATVSREDMESHCRRACGLCEDDDSSMMSTARPAEMSEECVDLAGQEMCEYYASEGTCTMPYGDTEATVSREDMESHCRRACGLCEDDDSSMMPAARQNEMSEGCSMDCFEAHPNKHVSYGTPSGGVMSLCECRDICDNDDACIGFDFNNDAAPYQDHSCWLHYVEGDLIWPAMDVDHYVNVC